MSHGDRDHLRELPHDVYWLYDAEGRVLYIGLSVQLEQRLIAHSFSKDWWPRVARVEVVTYPSKAEGFAAEGEAIRNERPLFNKRVPHGHVLPPIIRRDQPMHVVEESA